MDFAPVSVSLSVSVAVSFSRAPFLDVFFAAVLRLAVFLPGVFRLTTFFFGELVRVAFLRAVDLVTFLRVAVLLAFLLPVRFFLLAAADSGALLAGLLLMVTGFDPSIPKLGANHSQYRGHIQPA
jgi:hypothetical protein